MDLDLKPFWVFVHVLVFVDESTSLLYVPHASDSARDLLLYAEKSHDKENQKGYDAQDGKATHGFGKALKPGRLE